MKAAAFRAPRGTRPVRRAPPTLTTPRLVLRPIEPGDTDQLAALAGDPAVACHLDEVPAPFPRALAARWIARRDRRWRDRRGVTLAITRPPARALLGTVGLKVSTNHGRAELGYWMAADAWGHGLATEAAAALVGWGFEHLAIHRVHARVLSDNPGSQRVLVKLGLVVEGVRPRHYRRGRELVDVIELGIDRATWLSARRA